MLDTNPQPRPQLAAPTHRDPHAALLRLAIAALLCPLYDGRFYGRFSIAAAVTPPLRHGGQVCISYPAVGPGLDCKVHR